MTKKAGISQSGISRREALMAGTGAASLAAVAAGILPNIVGPELAFAQQGQEPLGGQPPAGSTPQ